MINKLNNKIKYLYRKFILKDKFILAHSKWINDDGDNKLRLSYKLNHNSIVFDLGGYEGAFTDEIYKKYSSNIYIFEPVESFFNIIKDKFSNISKIHCFPYGLSDKDESIEINISKDASSVFGTSEKKEIIMLKSIMAFIQKNKINNIDLFKINIEGGEFEILPELIKTGYISKIDNLQIQFHDFIDNATEKREQIRQELSKTHKLTYDYYFVWENWKRK